MLIKALFMLVKPENNLYVHQYGIGKIDLVDIYIAILYSFLKWCYRHLLKNIAITYHFFKKLTKQTKQVYYDFIYMKFPTYSIGVNMYGKMLEKMLSS